MMKTLTRILMIAGLLCLPLAASAQGTITRPKKPAAKTAATTTQTKKKTAPAAKTPKTPQGMFERGKAAFDRDNYAEAAKWYLRSAEQGNLYGMRGIGHLYERGLGVPKDFNEAAKWYRLGASKGDGWAKDALKRVQ